MSDIILHWSRFPGRFVDKLTGEEISLGDYKFRGSHLEWYEMLVETIIDCVNQLYSQVGESDCVNKTASLYASTDVCSLLRKSILFKEDPVNDIGEPVTGLGNLGGILCRSILVFEDTEAVDEERDIISVFVRRAGGTRQGNVIILDVPENGRRA